MSAPPAVTRIAALADLVTEVPADRFLDAARLGGAACVVAPEVVVPLTSYEGQDPPFPSKAARGFFAAGQYVAEAMRLYSLREARFFGSSTLFGAGDALVWDSALHWHATPTSDLGELMDQLARKITREPARLDAQARRLEGGYLLAGNHHFKNYFHWHVDVLPILTLARRVPGLEGFKVLLERETEFITGSLQALGYGRDRIVMLPKREAVVADQLVFATPLMTQGARLHPLAAEPYPLIKAALLGPGPRPAGRRIFASRGDDGRRRLMNRLQVEDRFRALGFEVVDPGSLSYRDQIALFDSAEVVVGEHGANMAGIGFCRPGALVVELFHPTRHTLVYVSLAEVSGLTHRTLIGEAEDAERWRLDAEAAVRTVEAAMARQPGVFPRGQEPAI